VSLGVLFPGQGSQFVGMGADLFEARPDLLGMRANEVLGFDLRQLCLQGPEEELTRTEHAQPALFAVSFALWAELEENLHLSPAGAAGHSLGEYTALAAAGAFDYLTALGLVADRGRAMARAADREPSGMAALLGASEQLVAEICQARVEIGGRLQVANVNAPGQIVVAGSVGDIQWLSENAPDLGVRRAIRLNVAGAFHSTFMAPAAELVGAALETVAISEPAFPVWANTNAAPHEKGEIASLLVRQVVEPVRFSETLQNMAASGVDTFVHVGPGDVTAGLARKTLGDVEVGVVSSLIDIASVASLTGTMS
jgi:[acyl-carrier-protein] S-malonyltransferase